MALHSSYGYLCLNSGFICKHLLLILISKLCLSNKYQYISYSIRHNEFVFSFQVEEFEDYSIIGTRLLRLKELLASSPPPPLPHLLAVPNSSPTFVESESKTAPINSTNNNNNDILIDQSISDEHRDPCNQQRQIQHQQQQQYWWYEGGVSGVNDCEREKGAAVAGELACLAGYMAGYLKATCPPSGGPQYHSHGHPAMGTHPHPHSHPHPGGHHPGLPSPFALATHGHPHPHPLDHGLSAFPQGTSVDQYIYYNRHVEIKQIQINLH